MIEAPAPLFGLAPVFRNLHHLMMALALAVAGADSAAAAEISTIRPEPGVAELRAVDGTALVIDRGGGTQRLRLVAGVPTLDRAAAPPPASRRADMLPDGRIAAGRRDIALAWLAGPTTRYRHGALGDGLEASRLHALDASGQEWVLELPDEAVFEDLTVRLADLDEDGRDEMAVIESHQDLGAALALYRLGEEGIEPVARTPAIGRPQRWLNPAGIGDLDGDGEAEIAIVVTPHIGGVLEVYQLDGDQLRLEHRAAGFSNHRYGSRTLEMSALVDADGDGVVDLALPGTDRRALRLLAFTGDRIRDLGTVAHPAAITTAIVALDLDGDGREELAYGLDDGSLVVLRF